MYFGDFNKGATVRIPFNTSGANGASITIATNGTAKAYVDGGTTEITSGVTLTEDFDAITGRHYIVVDTTGSGFTIGSEIDVAIDANTIDGQTVNAWVGRFSLNRRTPEKPYAGAIATYTNTTTVTGWSELPATADVLVGCLLVPVYGTGSGQAPRFISAYTSGRVMTLDPPLTAAFDTTTQCVVVRTAPASNAEIAQHVAAHVAALDGLSNGATAVTVNGVPFTVTRTSRDAIATMTAD